MRRRIGFRNFVSQRCRPTVAVAMSGGIDSSAVAVILKNQGYNVVGVFMRNWDASDEVAENVCQIDKDLFVEHRKKEDRRIRKEKILSFSFAGPLALTLYRC